MEPALRHRPATPGPRLPSATGAAAHADVDLDGTPAPPAHPLAVLAPRAERPGRAVEPPDHSGDWVLVAPFRARLIAAARARGLSTPDAQDAAHHVMCRAVERGGLDKERVETYLFRALAVRCDDVRAAAARQEELYARTRADDRLVGDLDDAVCDRAQAHWLLTRLPDRERAVVALSVAGETVTGIAAATGLSYPTVDRLLSRARRELRRIAAALGIVGIAVWRQRRMVAPSAVTAAVAVASVTVVTLPRTAPDYAAVPEIVRPVRVERTAVTRPATRPARPARTAASVAATAPAAVAPETQPTAVPDSTSGLPGVPQVPSPPDGEHKEEFNCSPTDVRLRVQALGWADLRCTPHPGGAKLES